MTLRHYTLICDHCGKQIETLDHKWRDIDFKRYGVVVTASRQYCSEKCFDDHKTAIAKINQLNVSKFKRVQ